MEQGHFAWQSKSASAERRHEIPNERMKHEDWSLVTMSDRSCSVDLIGPPTHTLWGSGARPLRRGARSLRLGKWSKVTSPGNPKVRLQREDMSTCINFVELLGFWC